MPWTAIEENMEQASLAQAQTGGGSFVLYMKLKYRQYHTMPAISCNTKQNYISNSINTKQYHAKYAITISISADNTRHHEVKYKVQSIGDRLLQIEMISNASCNIKQYH